MTQRNMRRSKIKMQSNRKISGMNRRKRGSMRCRATEGDVKLTGGRTALDAEEQEEK